MSKGYTVKTSSPLFTKENAEIKKCFTGWFVVFVDDSGDWMYKSDTLKSYTEALNFIECYRDDKEWDENN